MYFLFESHFFKGTEVLRYKGAKVFLLSQKNSHEFTNLLQKIHELMAKKRHFLYFIYFLSLSVFASNLLKNRIYNSLPLKPGSLEQDNSAIFRKLGFRYYLVLRRKSNAHYIYILNAHWHQNNFLKW